MSPTGMVELKIIIEGDALMIVNMLKSTEASCMSRYGAIYSDGNADSA